MGIFGPSKRQVNSALIEHGFKMRDEHADGSHDEYEGDEPIGWPFGPQVLCFECVGEDFVVRTTLEIPDDFPSRIPEASAYLLGWYLERTSGITKDSLMYAQALHLSRARRRTITGVDERYAALSVLLESDVQTAFIDSMGLELA